MPSSGKYFPLQNITSIFPYCISKPDSIEVQWFLRSKGLSEDPSAQQPPEIETKSMISQEPGHLRRSKQLLSYVQIATSQPMVLSTQTKALPPDNLAVQNK
eukprot:g51641.t1